MKMLSSERDALMEALELGLKAAEYASSMTTIRKIEWAIAFVKECL